MLDRKRGKRSRGLKPTVFAHVGCRDSGLLTACSTNETVNCGLLLASRSDKDNARRCQIPDGRAAPLSDLALPVVTITALDIAGLLAHKGTTTQVHRQERGKTPGRAGNSRISVLSKLEARCCGRRLQRSRCRAPLR